MKERATCPVPDTCGCTWTMTIDLLSFDRNFKKELEGQYSSQAEKRMTAMETLLWDWAKASKLYVRMAYEIRHQP